MSEYRAISADWFRKADNNLLSIRNNIGAADVPWDIVCFDGQQAAEKYLKGFLVARGVLPPEIHDLVRLARLCAQHDAAFESLVPECGELTDLGFASRYPDLAHTPGEADGRRAAELAELIRNRVLARLADRNP